MVFHNPGGDDSKIVMPPKEINDYCIPVIDDLLVNYPGKNLLRFSRGEPGYTLHFWNDKESEPPSLAELKIE